LDQRHLEDQHEGQRSDLQLYPPQGKVPNEN
jgi:hypothetical protein